MKVRGYGLKGHLESERVVLESFPSEALKCCLNNVSRCPLVSSKTAF